MSSIPHLQLGTIYLDNFSKKQVKKIALCVIFGVANLLKQFFNNHMELRNSLIILDVSLGVH